MVTMTFDTHSLVKELTEVGMPEPQAELLAHNHARLLDRELATKDDLKQFATKDDLKQFATKDDLKRFATKEDLKRFATKDDLKQFATKDDLKNFATKQDMKDLELRLTLRVGYMLTLGFGIMAALVKL